MSLVGKTLGLVAGAVLLSAIEASAATISFDPLAGTPDYSAIPAGYGSTATVAVSYRTEFPDGTPISDHLDFWNTGYGDLLTAAFASSNAAFAEITLTPIAGYSITLHSFDMAGWPYNDHGNISLFLEDGAGNPLLNVDPSGVIHGSGPTHDHFTPEFTWNGPLTIEWGADWNTGINDISFDAQPIVSTVPEPTSLCLLGTGLIGFCARRWRNHRKSA